MNKNELIAICKFLMTLYEKDNFKLYIKVNEFMHDNIVPLNDDDLKLVLDDEVVPLWVFIYQELIALVKHHYIIEKLKKL